MRDFILRRIIAAYVTDATGVPTPVDIVDSDGVSLLSGFIPDVPQIIGTIPAVNLRVGDDPVIINLANYITGASSYETSPLPSGVTRSGAIITITAEAVLATTTITIRGRNGGGLSDPLTLSVVIEPAEPLIVTTASISPASGPIGTVYAITPATWSGSGPFTRSGELRQAGIVVATRSGSSIAPFTFTSTAAGVLDWSETISGPGGTNESAASATITAVAPDPDPDPDPDPETFAADSSSVEVVADTTTEAESTTIYTTDANTVEVAGV